MVPNDVVIANLMQFELNVRDVKHKLNVQLSAGGIGSGQIHQSAMRFILRSEDNPKSILSCF